MEGGREGWHNPLPLAMPLTYIMVWSSNKLGCLGPFVKQRCWDVTSLFMQ